MHARVEDCIRAGKDCGIGRFPSHDFAMNSAWLGVSLIAAALLSWLRLTALDGDGPAPSRKPCVTGSCMPPGSWSAADAGGG